MRWFGLASAALLALVVWALGAGLHWLNVHEWNNLGLSEFAFVPFFCLVFAIPLVWGYRGWWPGHWAPFTYGAVLFLAWTLLPEFPSVTINSVNHGLNAAIGIILMLAAVLAVVTVFGLAAVGLAEAGRLAKSRRHKPSAPAHDPAVTAPRTP